MGGLFIYLFIYLKTASFHPHKTKVKYYFLERTSLLWAIQREGLYSSQAPIRFLVYSANSCRFQFQLLGIEFKAGLAEESCSCPTAEGWDADQPQPPPAVSVHAPRAAPADDAHGCAAQPRWPGAPAQPGLHEGLLLTPPPTKASSAQWLFHCISGSSLTGNSRRTPPTRSKNQHCFGTQNSDTSQQFLGLLYLCPPSTQPAAAGAVSSKGQG